MSQVWDVQSLTQPRKMLLLAVADFANDEGYSWPAVETLMRKCSFKSDSGVRRALAELADTGWLSKSSRSVKAANGRRQQGSNAYQLNLAKLLAESIAEPAPRTVSKPVLEPVPYEGSQHEPSYHEGSPHEGSYDGKKPGYEPVPGTPDPSLRSKHDPSNIKPPCQPPVATDPEIEITDRAKQVLAHLNMTTGSKYQTSKSSLDNIRARLREEFTTADLMLVVDYSVEKWGEDLEMAEYLRPSTLFQPTKFPGYLQTATKWETAGRPPRAEWGKKAATGNNAEREAAYKRYFKLTLDNKSKSDIETAARKEADGASVKAMRADFAKTTWNKIWAECSQRLSGGKAA